MFLLYFTHNKRKRPRGVDRDAYRIPECCSRPRAVIVARVLQGVTCEGCHDAGGEIDAADGRALQVYLRTVERGRIR